MNLELLTVPGRSEYLSHLMDYVTWAAAACGLDEAAAYRLSLAVDEIATNIVLHGYDDAGLRGDLTIWAEMDDQRLAVFLEDKGQPFDPRLAPRPADLDLPLEERQDGGLGIYLALWGVDGFTYEQDEARNLSVFIMNRPASAPSLDELEF